MALTRGDSEAIYHMVRHRLGAAGVGSGSGAGVGAPGPPGPAGAKGVTWRGEWVVDTDYDVGDIVYLATAGGALLTYLCIVAHTSTNIIPPAPGGTDNWWEISSGYLIIDGSRAMTGDLNMGEHDVDAAVNGHFSGDLTMDGAVGVARVSSPRVISMAGDHADDEAKVENLERVVFNDEPTASSIEKPSRIEYNVGVTAGADYSAAEGKSSWDDLEDTLVVYVASGAAMALVAVGWVVKLAVNGYNPS